MRARCLRRFYGAATQSKCVLPSPKSIKLKARLEYTAAVHRHCTYAIAKYPILYASMAPARCALALALVAAAQALAAPRSRRAALRMSIAPSDVVVMICA